LHMIGTSGGANNWIDAYHGGIESWRDETMQANYLTALYYAFVTVTTVGYGDILPVNDTERGFSIVMMFFGTAVFAFILGEMQSLVNKRRSTEVEFSHKMESVAEFMDYKRFPSYLRKSVRQFYNTIWKSNVVFDERAILLDLSPELRHEVAMFLKGHLISKVPFLRSASDAVVSSLVHRLHPEVVGKGDTIIRAGEAADCMFIIDTGEVVSKRLTGNPRKEQKTLMHDGMFFGELALLKEGTKRFETVRATRTTELMILSKKDLDLVLKEHPEAKDLLAEFNVRRPSFDEHEVTEEDLFKLADTDGDGVIDHEEFATYMAQRSAGIAKQKELMAEAKGGAANGSLSAVEFAAFMQGQTAISQRQSDDVGAAKAAAAGGDFAAASSGGLPPLVHTRQSDDVAALASEIAQLSKRFSAFEEATAAKLDRLLARMDHVPAEV